MQQKLFLLTSKRVAKRLTEVFDFVWPTAAAIWNLRWQVNGLISVSPDMSNEQLLGRFVTGSGIRGANLRRACVDSTWTDQQQEFARFLLFEFCSMYEAWCEGCLQELGENSELSKHLQFPTTITAGKINGITYALNSINARTSAVLSAAVTPTLQSNKKNSKPHLEELLVCYRYFKEARNSLIHAGGATSKRFVDAEDAYKQLTASSLGVREVPQFNACAHGTPVTLNLRGVVGFGEIVLRLVCSLDIEMSQSAGGEAAFKRRWKEKYGDVPVLIAHAPLERADRIRRLVRSLDLPTPVLSEQFEVWLKNQRLVS